VATRIIHRGHWDYPRLAQRYVSPSPSVNFQLLNSSTFEPSPIDCQLPQSFLSSPSSASLSVLSASALSSFSPLFRLLTFTFELSTFPKSFHHVSYAKTGGTPQRKKEFQNESQLL
jgi:hypothetical protein